MGDTRFWAAVNGILAVMVAVAILQAVQLASLRRELRQTQSGIRPGMAVCREEGQIKTSFSYRA